MHAFTDDHGESGRPALDSKRMNSRDSEDLSVGIGKIYVTISQVRGDMLANVGPMMTELISK